jgi:hypothetical protein
MAEPKNLRMGVETPSPDMREEETRVAVLEATIEHYLPNFAEAVAKMQLDREGEINSVLFLHQDAFAAGYDDDEYLLLGMAIKYAGLRGVDVHITGTNHATF